MSSPKVANVRLANNVMSGLDDILVECGMARKLYREAMNHAKNQMDLVQVGILAQLIDHITTIEIKASDARKGEYRDIP